MLKWHKAAGGIFFEQFHGISAWLAIPAAKPVSNRRYLARAGGFLKFVSHPLQAEAVMPVKWMGAAGYFNHRSYRQRKGLTWNDDNTFEF